MVDFALVNSGTLSGQANITDVQGGLQRDHVSRSVTGSPDGTTYREVLGRFIWKLSAQGFWDTGSRTYPLPIGAASSNGPIGRLSRVRLVKQQELINATAGPDGIDDIVFSTGVITYYGSATGYLQSTETPLATTGSQAISQFELSNFAIPLDNSRDVTANAKIRNMQQRYRFSRGGPVMVRFHFTLTDTVTLNGANHPFNATQFTASLDSDNGQQHSGTVYYRSMQADIDYENGSPIAIQVEGPMSGTPADSITST